MKAPRRDEGHGTGRIVVDELAEEPVPLAHWSEEARPGGASNPAGGGICIGIDMIFSRSRTMGSRTFAQLAVVPRARRSGELPHVNGSGSGTVCPEQDCRSNGMELNMEQPHSVEEQRHSGRTLATWSAVVASAVFVAAFLVWVMVVQPYDRNQNSDGRSNEQSGQSVAARHGPLVPKLDPTTGGRPQVANENAREIDQSFGPPQII